MSNPEIKGDPIPVRFEPPEEFMIETLARKTGFSRSEIIRRCVRLAKIQMAQNGPNIFYEVPAEERTKPKRRKKPNK